MNSRFEFARNSVIFWSFLGVLIVYIGAFTGVDIKLADYYFDFTSNQFPWKSNPFAKVFLHSWLKAIIVAFGLALIGVSLIDSIKPIFKPYLSLRLRIVSICAIIIPSVITALKRNSFSHCPWDIARYGGDAPYVKIFDTIPALTTAGHCMPAGHASTALWLAAFSVFWLPSNPRKALLIAVAGLGFGFFLGWFQQMRGAHFLTHTLWSVWIAGVILTCLIVYFWNSLHSIGSTASLKD